MSSVRINPSILSADFAHFAEELERIRTADAAHVDVMDNHFVPNLTFGAPVVRRLQEVTPVPLDLHLMISDADRWAPRYAELGVWSVTFHVEACRDVRQTVRDVASHGARVGIAVKPGTDPEPYLDLLGEVDQVLVMTVEPGFGGQPFMADMMPKLARVRAAAEAQLARRPDFSVQVDGGITAETAPTAVAHGANCLVAGSAVYGRGNPAEAIAGLRAAAEPERIS